jgi:hypothetical protein
MPKNGTNRGRTWSWLVVAAVGAIVIYLLPTLGLFGRLSAGQEVLDGARPAFTEERVTGARVGIDGISTAVNAFDPVMTEEGGAAAEVPQLVAFVAEETGLTEAEVLEALGTSFPHTTNLLLAVPLTDVSAELPELVEFLSSTLGLSTDEVLAALTESFPHLATAITDLPVVTGGWASVEGVEELTRFDGESVSSVPEIRDYFSDDVIPVVENLQENFDNLDNYPPPVNQIPPLLLVIGLVTLAFGALMAWRSYRNTMGRNEQTLAWGVVIAVGLLVVGIVVGFRLFPALNGGQDMVGDLKPVFDEDRVEADGPALAMVGTVVELVDQIATSEGGASDEVPALITFVAGETGLGEDEVLVLLEENFPKTTALLKSLPLENVSAELPELITFLSTTLGITPEEVASALATNFPALNQSIENLPLVTETWDNIEGAPEFTRFDGTPITAMADVPAYYAEDVVPMLDDQRQNFERLDAFPTLKFFPPLLLVVGVVVVIYGAFMLVVSRRKPEASPS